jgi:hypothetical protein
MSPETASAQDQINQILNIQGEAVTSVPFPMAGAETMPTQPSPESIQNQASYESSKQTPGSVAEAIVQVQKVPHGPEADAVTFEELPAAA